MSNLLTPPQDFALTPTQHTNFETIHTVVLLTDYIDGALLKRAIRQSLSPDVKIVGGTLSSSDLAAEGTAKLALRRLESWEEVRRTERVREFLGSVKSEGYEEW